MDSRAFWRAWPLTPGLQRADPRRSGHPEGEGVAHMDQLQAQRRLVKSPPELWAEISDEDVLRHHLAPFGAIRITRREPESTVAWEGERASGTVSLDAAGGGTRGAPTPPPVLPPGGEPGG